MRTERESEVLGYERTDDSKVFFIDVPKFKQTMVSMGQLEKMGLRYTVVGNIRNFLTPNNSIFLSFTLAANNLYVLASSNHSSSSASY